METMFKVDPNKNQRMVQLFSELISDAEVPNHHTIVRCYKNRLEYNCSYPHKIENILDSFHTLVMKREAPPDWVSLLD